jgi:formamidopyrimidine-DNA glycosylase
MPELPEVESVARKLRDDGVEGARIQGVEVLRPSSIRPQSPDDIDYLTRKQTIRKVERRAKNILIHLSKERIIRIHFGMTGDLVMLRKGTEMPAVARVAWRLSGARELVFTDGRALGRANVLSSDEWSVLDAGLGPEPLARSFTSERFYKSSQSSRLPAKLFLMDQSKIAGLGNIYAAEALFRGQVSPTRPMNTLTQAEAGKLHAAIRQTLRSAIQSVYRAYRKPGGYRQHGDDFERAVYGRAGEPCSVCGREIRRIRHGGRSTYFCSYCQR